MSIKVVCNCGKEYNVKNELAGKIAKCKVCGADVFIPNPPKSGAAEFAHVAPAKNSSAARPAKSAPKPSPYRVPSSKANTPASPHSRKLIFASGGALLLLVAGVILVFSLRDTWERDHRDEIIRLSGQVNELAKASDLAGAVAQQDKLQALLTDHSLKDPAAQQAVGAAKDGLESLRLKVKQAEERKKAQELAGYMVSGRVCILDGLQKSPKENLSVFLLPRTNEIDGQITQINQLMETLAVNVRELLRLAKVQEKLSAEIEADRHLFSRDQALYVKALSLQAELITKANNVLQDYNTKFTQFEQLFAAQQEQMKTMLRNNENVGKTSADGQFVFNAIKSGAYVLVCMGNYGHDKLPCFQNVMVNSNNVTVEMLLKEKTK